MSWIFVNRNIVKLSGDVSLQCFAYIRFMHFLYGLLFSTLTSKHMLFNHVIGFPTSPQFADNEDFQSEWREVKRRNKIKVASFLKEKTGYLVNPDAMFDVQVIFCISNICSVSLVLCFSYFIMEKQRKSLHKRTSFATC